MQGRRNCTSVSTEYMARNLSVNETVYIPCSRVSGLDTGVSMYRTKVVEVAPRAVKVQLRGGQVSDSIGSSLVHRNIGILILNVGDFQSEMTLLDPLAKSVAQFCRLLVGDDYIKSLRIRSLEELRTFWTRHQAAYSHVIWIGHGANSGIKFAVGGWKSAENISDALQVRGAPRKTYISLCCKTGYQSFGGQMSSATICRDFIGPFHAVQGATASQFCQTFLISHFLEGATAKVAFKHARNLVPGSASFRLWRSGTLTAGPKS